MRKLAQPFANFTNTSLNWDKYNFQFGQIHFEVHMWCLQVTSLKLMRKLAQPFENFPNTSLNWDKYNYQFGQIHF